MRENFSDRFSTHTMWSLQNFCITWKLFCEINFTVKLFTTEVVFTEIFFKKKTWYASIQTFRKLHTAVPQFGNLTNFPPRNFFENFPWNQCIEWLYLKTYSRKSWKSSFRGAMRYFALLGFIIYTYFTTKNCKSHSGSLWFTKHIGHQKRPTLTLDIGPKIPDLRSLKVKN